MSEFFFERLLRELPSIYTELRNHGTTAKELDEEIEKISGKDCDDVAKTASRKDFEKMAKEALARLAKKRKVAPMEIAA